MAVVKMSDIAQRVGVSVAAVSMALNGRPGVSDAMRERIIAEAEACGYDMRKLSVSTAKKTQILVYDADYPKTLEKEFESSSIRSDFMKGIEQTAEFAKVAFTHAYSRSDGFELSDIPPGTDGILIVSVTKHENLSAQIKACDLPCVVVGNSMPGEQVHTVAYDNFGAMSQVVRLLAAAGHRKIGFIRTKTNFQNNDERFDGWFCTCRRLGLTPGPVLDVEYESDALYEGLPLLLQEHLADTTAFVTWNDYLALATLRALRSCGAEPGKDVAVVGFDDMPFSVLGDPPLATVHIDEMALSATAMSYLLELIQNPQLPVTHRTLPLDLVIRDSFCAAGE